MAQRKVPSAAELATAVDAVTAWLDDATAVPAGPVVATAVRTTARYLAAQHPGGAVELRVPPYVAVQLLAGLDHRRGTPPNVVEMPPRTWLLLAAGRLAWADAVDSGLVLTSGTRADIATVLPVLDGRA